MKTEKSSSEHRRFTIKERLEYWFDNRVTRGSLSLIRVLIVISILLALVIAALIIAFRFNEKGEVASVEYTGPDYTLSPV